MRISGRGVLVHAVVLAGLGTILYAGPDPFDSDSDGLSDLEEMRPIQAVSFGSRRMIDAGSSFWYPQSLDFDGDADSDVLISDLDLDELFWYENQNGAGAFASRHSIAALPGVGQAIGGDTDGDGDIDVFAGVAVGGVGPDQVGMWVENLGEGMGFAAPAPITEARSWSGKALGDLDGDGDLDLVLVADTGVYTFENLGGENGFAAEAPLGGANRFQVHLADLDGDTDLDILTGSFSGGAAWLENLDGAGSFGPLIPVDELQPNAWAPSSGDLNGDGHTDVINSSAGTWHPGPPSGGAFGASRPLSATGYWPAAPADLDLDGDIDLVSTGADGLAWSENLDGEGAFGPPLAIDSIGPNFHLADVDGDGDMDIVAEAYPDELFFWYRNDSVTSTDPFDPDSDDDGLLDGEELDVYATDPNRPDSDGDGLQDGFEVAAGFDPNAPLEHAQDPDVDAIANLGEDFGGTDPNDPDSDEDGLSDGAERSRLRESGFGSPRIVTLTAVFSEQLVVADIDGDGDSDVLLGTDGPDWYENLDGSGNFGSDNVSHFPDAAVALGDLDGDGDLDVVTADPGSGDVGWKENAGGFLASPFQPIDDLPYSSISPLASIGCADLDGDGDLDVVAVSEPNELTWYENLDGLGTFGSATIIGDLDPLLLEYRTNPILAVDLTGDGLGDVLVAGPTGRSGWYESARGRGPDGSLRVLPGIYPVRVTSFAAADFDGDLDLDVAASIGSVTRVYLNLDGLGALEPGAEMATEDARVSAFDLDGDGDPDLLAHSTSDGHVAWWENIDAGESFEPHVIFEASDIEAVSAGDFDGDGDLDLVSNRPGPSGPRVIEWHPNPGSDPLDATSPAPEPSAKLLGAVALVLLALMRRSCGPVAFTPA